MCKAKKVTVFEKAKYLHQHGILPVVFRFFRSSITHITLEMLITVYILELFAFITKYFVVDPTDFPRALVFVVTPLLVTLPVALLFAAGAVYYFAIRCYCYHNKYKEYSNKAQLENVLKKYRMEIIVGHFVGFMCYLLVPLFISLWVDNAFYDKFNHHNHLVFWMAVIGGVLGLMWNVTGAIREQRLFWHLLLPKLKDSKECAEVVAKRNYNCFFHNLLWNLLSLATIIALVVIILFNLHDQVKLEAITKDYSFLILYLISLVILYGRSIYKLLYSEKNKKALIYPPLSAVFGVLADEDGQLDTEEIEKGEARSCS